MQPDVFTLPSERHAQKLVIEEIDQGHELDMEELVRSAARIEAAEHAHHHSASRDDDDVVDLSDQSNMLSLDENPALEDERQEFESKARRKIAVAVGTVLLEMLDCLPEPVIKRSLHDHVTTADLSDPKLPEPYHILSRLSNPVRTRCFLPCFSCLENRRTDCETGPTARSSIHAHLRVPQGILSKQRGSTSRHGPRKDDARAIL